MKFKFFKDVGQRVEHSGEREVDIEYRRVPGEGQNGDW